MKAIIKIGSVGILFAVMQSCSSVNEFERAALQDEQMQLAPKKTERFETYFQVYREGAAGANGGKVGGGCGCN